MLTQLDIKELTDGVTIRVKVQPRASKNQIQGISENALRVRLTAPPADGEANVACTAFLGRFFGVAKSRVVIISGHTSRSKVIKLVGMSRKSVLERLGEALS